MTPFGSAPLLVPGTWCSDVTKGSTIASVSEIAFRGGLGIAGRRGASPSLQLGSYPLLPIGDRERDGTGWPVPLYLTPFGSWSELSSSSDAIEGVTLACGRCYRLTWWPYGKSRDPSLGFGNGMALGGLPP